jgi:predicted HAD superfamily Cof-like phosphohydrolase
MEPTKPPIPQPGLTNAQKIVEFHDAVGSPVPPEPVVPALGILQLRQKLLQEEFAEASEAWEQLTAVLQSDDPAQPADVTDWVHELTDLLYVTYGAILACGVDADAVFAEVHRANLSKAGGPRRADGKILKPPGWQPADVRSVIENQMNGGIGD